MDRHAVPARNGGNVVLRAGLVRNGDAAVADIGPASARADSVRCVARWVRHLDLGASKRAAVTTVVVIAHAAMTAVVATIATVDMATMATIVAAATPMTIIAVTTTIGAMRRAARMTMIAAGLRPVVRVLR